MMRAAVIREHGTLLVERVPEPDLPRYAARCEIVYGSTCTGTDSHIIAGNFPWLASLPTILGHESVGRVVETGEGVRNFRVGDLVTRVGTPAIAAAGISVNWGGFAEVALAWDHWAMCADGLPRSEWRGHRVNQVIPPAVDPRDAPMFTTWRETLSYALRAGVGEGATVLVVGSGGNGLSIAAHAINLGAAAVVMVGSQAVGRRVEGRLSLERFVDYRDPDATRTLADAFSDGFDFVFDAIGRQRVADGFLALVRDGGVYSTYGIDEYGGLSVDPTRARGRVVLHPCVYDEAETHQAVCELVLQGRLDAGLWYDREAPYELAEIARAFEDVVDRRTAPKALVAISR